MIFKKKKFGSSKGPIFTFCVFDAESKTEFTNISGKPKKSSKILRSVNLGPRYFQFVGKTRAQKYHATVPLTPPIFFYFGYLFMKKTELENIMLQSLPLQILNT